MEAEAMMSIQALHVTEAGDYMLIPRDLPIPSLLEFIGSWVPDLSSSHRMNAVSIPAFIPPPLRAIYEFAGNYPIPNSEQWRRPNWTYGLFGPQDQLLPIDQLKQNGGRFRFIHENQGVWHCETEANAADPPVFSDATAYDHGEPEGTMRVVCPSLSHFLTTFCLQEVFFGSQQLFCIDSEVAAPADLVTDELADVWINGIYVYNEPTHSFYICRRGLFVMDTGGSFWLAFNDDRYAKLINNSNSVRRIH